MENVAEAKLGNLKVGKGLPMIIAGVINLSPESFYSGSIAETKDSQSEMVEKHIVAGAQMIDIGGLSTRPISYYGGEKPPRKIEFERVQDFLPPLLDSFTSYPKVEISIDTMHSEIADFALNKGVRTVNDVCGLKKDPKLASVVADHDASLIIMAANESPGDVYTIPDVISALRTSISMAHESGVDPEKIVIDPGIGGWGGREHHLDLYLLTHLNKLSELNRPIHVGLSRKSTIGRIINESNPEFLLPGTLSATTFLILREEIHAIRTHDVYETVQAVKVIERLISIAQE